MDKIKTYWKYAKDNPKITGGVIIAIIIIYTLIT